MKSEFLVCVFLLCGLSLPGVDLSANTNRAILAAQRQEQLQEMQKKFRESSIKINTDLELRLRANQLAREQTEREKHCVICESALKDGRPAVEWESNRGVSLIYDSSDLCGAYVKVDQTGRVVKVGSFEAIPELVYREKILDSIMARVRADTNECAAAKERAIRKVDAIEAGAMRLRRSR